MNPARRATDDEYLTMKFERLKLGIDRTNGGPAPPGVSDFSASLNPLGPPPQALAAYHDAAALVARYPSPYPGDPAARLARRHRVEPDNIVVGNGSPANPSARPHVAPAPRARRDTDLQRNSQCNDRCGSGDVRDAVKTPA